MNTCLIIHRNALKYCIANQKCLRQFAVPTDLCLVPQHTYQRHFCPAQSCSYSNWALEKKNQLKETVFHQWENFYTKYEEFVGLTDVQDAQLEVKRAEENFLKARTDERSVMRDVLEIRDKLKHVRERLSHVDYSNPLYPQLANEQHELVTKEERIKLSLDAVEEKERDTFHVLSAAVRDSYEKERARVERTKNWSLIGSVIGTIIGMFGSAYLNRVRTKDLKQMIAEKDHNKEIQESISQVLPHADEQYNDIKEEIKQLQVCLINKLLDPPSEKKGGEVFAEQSSNDFNSILKSINKVLQGFQDQLVKLSELSSQNKATLTAQSDNIRDELKNLSVNEDRALIFNELVKIKKNLARIQPPMAAGSTLYEEEPTNYEQDGEIVPSIDTQFSYNNTSTQSGTFLPVKNFVIWGAIMTTVYYILSV